MDLINNWLSWVHSRGLSYSAGLRELNECLGTQYRTNNLYRWRSGTTPDKLVLDYMRYCITKSVLDERLDRDIPQEVADLIAQDLS